MVCWRACILTVCCLSPTLLFAADLKSLRKEYEDTKAKIGGQPKDRADKVQKNVLPILEKIGAIDSNESLSFLLGEYKTAAPEVGAACAGPILASKNEGAAKLLLQAFSEKNRVVAIGTLEALAKTKRNLAPVESELVRIAQTIQDAEVRKAIPPALARLDSLAAAKALLAHLQVGKAQKGEDPQQVYNARVVEALKATKNDEIKKWLASAAFHAAGSDPAKLVALANLAGELSLADARPELEKLVGNPSKEVAAAAVSSLAKVGLGNSTEGLVEALEKRKGKDDTAFRVQALDALARSGSDASIDAVLRYSRGTEPEMRAAAMGSLALCKDNPKALEGILKGLEDSDASVKAAALRAVASKREKAMIAPLIEVVGKEKEDRLKIQAAELLASLTGQGQIGLVYEDWKKWWETSEARFEFPKDGEKLGTSVKAKKDIDLSYFGIEVSSKRLAFVLDCSGSMLEEVPVRARGPQEKDKDDGPEAGKKDGKTVVAGGEGKSGGDAGGNGGGGGSVPTKNGKAKKIDILKKELPRLLKKLPPDTQINIITFNKTFTQWQPQLQPLAGAGRAKAIDFVEKLGTGHGTNVFDTLEAALKDKRVDTIYLLTDGEPHDGRIIEPQAILREIQVQNRVRGATIHCVAFGAESPFLKQLAEQNGGKYQYVDSY